MNSHLLTVSHMVIETEGALLPNRLARAERVAEARRFRESSDGLRGRLHRAIGATFIGTVELRWPICRRSGAQPASMVILPGVAK
jgi:hypothetical protein